MLAKGRATVKIDGEEVSAELEKINDEIVKLKTCMNLDEKITAILESVARIETKVEIHNNYESRLRVLEKNQYKFMGVLIVMLIIIQLLMKTI